MEGGREISQNLSINVLRPRTKEFISNLLNPRMFTPTRHGIPRDWQGLAALCNIDDDYEANLVQDVDPTMKLLKLWCEKEPNLSTIQRFVEFLEEMDRFDVVADISKFIEEDIKLFNSKIQQPRCEESRELEDYYHAFLLYDQDDKDFAKTLWEKMEKDYNIKICLKDRDLPGGGFEIDRMITLITERCNRLIVILSDSFFSNSFNNYYVKFAYAFSIENKTNIIPIRYKDVVIPFHMKYLSILNYKQRSYFNFWNKLRDDICEKIPQNFNIARNE